MTNLRVRLVLWTVALEAILLVIFAIILVWFLQNTQNRQLEETLRLSAAELNAVVDVRDNRYLVSARETEELRLRGILAWIIAPDGQIGLAVGQARTYPLPQPVPSPGRMTDGALADGTPVRLLAAYLQEGNHQLGTLVLALSLQENQRFIRQILVGVGLAIPVVLVLSAGGGLFLANRALAPVAIMAATAQQISAKDLSQRLALDLPNDEIGHLARTFNAMLDRLERAFQRERQFTADASHELRTPLGFLKTQLSLARSRPRDAATLLQMMADMENDVDRMTHLVEQMLTLARVEQSEAIQFEPIALGELLAHLIQHLQPKAQEKHLSLTLKYASQANLQISGNKTQLQQVFSNLIENAVKYTPAGGQIEVSLNRNWQQIVVTIADTGPGIDPAHLPHLFTRFYRVDSARARDTGGFGLGLAISQAIVQAHHGEINVTNISGNGTTFTVILPVSFTI